MENLTRRRTIAIATALFGCLAVTAIASQPTGDQTDHSCYIGFPVPFREWGGIGGRNYFSLPALLVDLLAILAVTYFTTPVFQKRLRPHIALRPRFHLVEMIFAMTLGATLLGILTVSPDSAETILPLLGLGGPFIALGLAYAFSKRHIKEIGLGNFLLLITAMLPAFFLGSSYPLFDTTMTLLQIWAIPLWVIWLVWVADVQKFFPEPYQDDEGGADD